MFRLNTAANSVHGPRRGRRSIVFALLPLLVQPFLVSCRRLAAAAWSEGPRFEITFPASVHRQPITGRVFLTLSTSADSEPRLQVGGRGDRPPLFGLDVSELAPGKAATVDVSTPGYPASSLRGIPAGDYYVQAVINVYTQFHRADGKTIWAHMDQWEGQKWNRSPGNLYSDVRKIHFDPKSGSTIAISTSKVIPPVDVPADTRWVKRIKFQSRMLSDWWGVPTYLGAVVLLPKGYDEHPGQSYPVVYQQGHFGLAPAFGFRTDSGPAETADARARRLSSGRETGYEFHLSWDADDFPRLIAVTFQHPTPYFDDSYAVNSANNGPYGDAIMQELIPYVEEHFRIIRKPYARVLTGGSTGGWEALALQLYHPDFFGGTWPMYPDPIDFRDYVLDDVYTDDNAFLQPGLHWTERERWFQRDPEGQPEMSMRALSRLEDVLGSHGRSASQLEIWEAVYGPVGADGYTKPLWDKRTGKIDHAVADYMREHGYDLRDYAQRNWSSIGPQLVGKIHLICGDMDNYWLNLAVYRMQDFLEQTRNPPAKAAFLYGRPLKGHGYQGMTSAQLIREMYKYMQGHLGGSLPDRLL